MAGSMLIAYILPLCHLSMALRYSRTNSPRFVAGIYPLIGFKSPLELFKDPAISKSITMRTRYTNSKTSFGFLPPTALSFQEIFFDRYRRIYPEHLRGLVTTLASHRLFLKLVGHISCL
jgi:hypothetical protein